MIRVLVADDSRAFRAVLRAVLERSPGVEVMGEAADGAEAVAFVERHRPDVVTMDVRMPGKDGLEAIEEIMARRPTPVVVVSGEVGPAGQATAFRALALGAVEVLAKPSASEPGRFEREAEEIRMAVRSVAGLTLVTRHPRRRAAGAPPPAPHRRAAPLAPPARRAVGLVASTGGPPALARLLGALPAGFPAAVLVVQHIAAGFEGGLAHWLAGETPLAVKLAEDGERLRPATVYLAPEGRHLTARGGAVALDDGPPVRGLRPSGSALLRSLAAAFGRAATGVVLTGMGDDGADGLLALRQGGGHTIAQGPASCVVFGMPREAVARGAAAETLELDEIAPALLRWTGLRGAP